jgi:hypothetical protein
MLKVERTPQSRSVSKKLNMVVVAERVHLLVNVATRVASHTTATDPTKTQTEVDAV